MTQQNNNNALSIETKSTFSYVFFFSHSGDNFFGHGMINITLPTKIGDYQDLLNINDVISERFPNREVVITGYNLISKLSND